MEGIIISSPKNRYEKSEGKIYDEAPLFVCHGHSPSDGCSKPQSTIARRISGFNKKSRKPEL